MPYVIYLQLVTVFDFRKILTNGSLLIERITAASPAVIPSGFSLSADEGLYECVIVIDGVGSLISRKASLKVAGNKRFLANFPPTLWSLPSATILFDNIVFSLF